MIKPFVKLNQLNTSYEFGRVLENYSNLVENGEPNRQQSGESSFFKSSSFNNKQNN